MRPGLGQKAAFWAGALVGIAVALLIMSLVPEPRPPVGRARSGPVPPSHALPIAPGQRLRYVIGWEKVPAGTVIISQRISRKGGGRRLEVHYQARTSRAVDAIWRFRAAGMTIIDPETRLPLSVALVTREGEEEKHRTIVFNHAAGRATIKEFEVGEGERESWTVPIDSTMDVASALLLLGRAGKARSLRLLAGDELYEVSVRPAGQERLEVPAGTFPARKWLVDVRSVPAEDEFSPPVTYSGRAWVARDSGLPLRLEADVLLGRITIRLAAREPEGAPGGR